MLSLLKIKNVALIDDVTVEFGDGLNLLTGETGSGKSIIVDALGTLIGYRVSSDLVKTGEDSASIEGLFSGVDTPEARELCSEAGIELSEDGEIIIRRELSRSGRNRVFINNQLATQGLLKKVGTHLADIHGQGEQTSLYSPASHMGILDRFADTEKELDKVRSKYREWNETRGELARVRDSESELLQLEDVLRFQVNEIEGAALEQGEDDSLEQERKRLANSEKLAELGSESYGLLYENDEAVTANLEKVSRMVDELSNFDSGFDEYKEGLEAAKATLDELAYALRDYSSSIEFSPERLSEIENRLTEIYRLKRKYGGSLDAVLTHFEESKKRLRDIEHSDARERELESKLESLAAEYETHAGKLRAKRKKAARKFEKAVCDELSAVALEKAIFEVRFEEFNRDSSSFFSADGSERIEFFFSANPGVEPKPLSKVASGGEASRIMLILKTASGGSMRDKAGVFDEVDAGVGGRVAEAVGLKLKRLSRSQQVFCVTHHPQVAALADHHFVVEKSLGSDTTSVEVRALVSDEIVEEIARMLDGENVTETAREHARQLVSSGEEAIKAGA